ncbi:hypothetical protein HPB52_025626 [Rhipicephalus sanguineus]|uniref:Uncharacterized protein n=1 Tax=Rhipicephalus sanguineus TaxID=34632 RepID=A0A9D4TCU1_RHISA|nr:hypothetical protein HPB52_025626 [Rhipicephalus sanguineus]
MFALVRFVEEKTDKRYVISVADVANFEPQNELDFDNTMPYDAYWHDEDDDVNSGMYAVQILKLAATARAVLEEDPISNEQQQAGDFMATPDGRESVWPEKDLAPVVAAVALSHTQQNHLGHRLRVGTTIRYRAG